MYNTFLLSHECFVLLRFQIWDYYKFGIINQSFEKCRIISLTTQGYDQIVEISFSSYKHTIGFTSYDNDSMGSLRRASFSVFSSKENKVLTKGLYTYTMAKIEI